MTSEIELGFNDTQLRVSSVLNKDNKNYGKKNLIDGSEETCWNSESGSPQWIQITPNTQSTLTSVAIKFQGGFAARRMIVEERQDDGSYSSVAEFFPEDHGKLQIFRLPTPYRIEEKPFRLTFTECYDMFGRIIIYMLKFHQSQ